MTRKEAIELLRSWDGVYIGYSSDEVEEALNMAIQALSQEPTEKPMCDRNICISNEYNGIGCDECVVNKEQEPCDDAISREAVLDGLKGCMCEDWVKTLFATMVKQLPSVTQKSGKWQVVSDGYGDSAYICECSECKDTVWVYKNADRKWKYCPNCGAKMESEE